MSNPELKSLLANSARTGKITGRALAEMLKKHAEDEYASSLRNYYQNEIPLQSIKGRQLGRALREGKRRGLNQVWINTLVLFSVPQVLLLCVATFNPVVSLGLFVVSFGIGVGISKQ